MKADGGIDSWKNERSAQNDVIRGVGEIPPSTCNWISKQKQKNIELYRGVGLRLFSLVRRRVNEVPYLYVQNNTWPSRLSM